MTPASPRPVLIARHVGKTFGEVTALVDVDLEVHTGEFVTLVGPSGCGKSTLLRLFAGLSECTTGSVTLGGSTVEGPRQDVGMMFQRPTLLPWSTAIENVLLPARIKGRVGPAERQEAARLLDVVGLEDFHHGYPQHLSGGMQQRVALARLLMLGVDVLLLDEPFGAVDEFTRERLNLELLRIHQATGSTIVLVTHNITESVLLADRVIAMTPRPGRVARSIEVPFDRPRDLDVMRDPEFTRLTLEVRESFSDLDLDVGADR